MQEIDDIFEDLRVAKLPLAITDLDGAVLARAAQMRSTEMRRTSAVAATLALFLGIGASALSAPQASAAPSAPLGALSPLAPSALLAG